jgi:hypothetical protein
MALKEISLETRFTTLFHALWYQDFPVDPDDVVSRANWTIHIGVCVKRSADLLGWRAYFEDGKRTDAVIRDGARQSRIAVEWEWIQAHRDDVNEIDKLAEVDQGVLPVFITYSRLDHHDKNMKRIQERWPNDRSLLLFVVRFENAKTRRFTDLETYRVTKQRAVLLHRQPALPWEVESSRWATSAPTSADE